MLLLLRPTREGERQRGSDCTALHVAALRRNGLEYDATASPPLPPLPPPPPPPPLLLLLLLSLPPPLLPPSLLPSLLLLLLLLLLLPPPPPLLLPLLSSCRRSSRARIRRSCLSLLDPGPVASLLLFSLAPTRIRCWSVAVMRGTAP